MHRRTSIYLDDNAMKALKLLAVASGTTVSDIQEPVDMMLAAQIREVDWPAEIEAMLDRARARHLAELSGEEIMAEIKAVRLATRTGIEKNRHADT